MKLDPPLLAVGPLSGAIFVVTHGKVEPHPTIPDHTMVTATVKYDVTYQFNALASERAAIPPEPLQDGGEQPETWMVDYEHGDGEPQHAVLSWLDDEAKDLPEVGTQLVRKSDYDALKSGPASYEGVTRMLREVQEERDELRLRARKAEEALGQDGGEREDDLRALLRWVRQVGMNGPREQRPLSVSPEIGCAVMRLEAEHPHQDVERLREAALGPEAILQAASYLQLRLPPAPSGTSRLTIAKDVAASVVRCALDVALASSPNEGGER